VQLPLKYWIVSLPFFLDDFSVFFGIKTMIFSLTMGDCGIFHTLWSDRNVLPVVGQRQSAM